MMMSSLKLSLIFGAALGLYQFIAQNANYLPSVVPQYNTDNTDQLTTPTSFLQLKPGFDYFLFVLKWPAAFCNIKVSKGKTKCKPYPLEAEHQNKFTVHGLWPQLNSAQSPGYCTPAPSIQDSDIIPFKDDLLEYWPDLFDAKNFQSKDFWKRQWNKHGTCSSNKFNPQDYLKITLDLAKKYAKPIFDELHNKGIKPDGTKTRRLEDLRQIVLKFTGYNPIPNIVLNDSGAMLLLEIALSVQNDGVTLMNCDEVYKFAAP